MTWWLKRPVSTEFRHSIPILSREWGDVANAEWLPNDLVAACGAGKQRLYVIPSLKLVVVRQGGLSQGFNDTEFLSLLLRGKSAGKSAANSGANRPQQLTPEQRERLLKRRNASTEELTK